MFCSRDYIDILKNLFKRFDSIKTQKVIQDKTILIDDKIIIEQFLNSGKSLKQIVNRFQKSLGKDNKIKVFFEGDYFLNNKNEYDVLNDYIYAKIIEKFQFQAEFILNFLQKKGTTNEQKYIDSYTISQISIQYQNQLMKFLSQKKIDFQISCFQASHQLSYDSFMSNNKDAVFFCNPFLFALKNDIDKIYFSLEKNHIQFYDFQDLSNKLNINKQMLHSFFLLGYIFYRANNYYKKDIRVNRIFKKNKIRLQQFYVKELDRSTLYVLYLFQRFKLIKSSSFSISSIQKQLQFSNAKKNHLQNILKIVQNGYVFDQNLCSVVSYNIITYEKTKFKMNNFISDYAQYLKNKGLIPKELQNWFFRKKNNCVFKTSLNYIQSKELFIIQKQSFFDCYKQIIQNYYIMLFNMNPDKILVKKYYGNIFYYELQPKNLKCFKALNDDFQESSIQKVMDYFKDNTSQLEGKKKTKNLNINEIFNLSFLYFLHSTNYLNMEDFKISNEFEFVRIVSGEGYFQEILILLELYRKEFINEEAFLLDVSLSNVVPNLKEKKQTLFQKVDFLKYKSDIFNMDLLTLFQIYQEYKQEQSFQKFFYIAIKQNLLKSFHHFQENIQWILLEIFLIIEQFYVIEAKEIVWSLFVSKVINYHSEINNLSIIALLNQNNCYYSDDYDLRSHRASQVIQCITDQFHALLMSILCNVAFQQNQIESLCKNFKNILFSFTSQCSIGAKVKKQIILLLVYPLIKTHFANSHIKYLAILQDNFNFHKKNKHCQIEKIWKFQQSIEANLKYLKKSSLYKKVKNDSHKNMVLLNEVIEILQQVRKDLELKKQII